MLADKGFDLGGEVGFVAHAQPVASDSDGLKTDPERLQINTLSTVSLYVADPNSGIGGRVLRVRDSGWST